MAEVGSVFVSVIPSAKGFGKALNSQIAPGVSAAGIAAGASVAGGIAAGGKTGGKGFASSFKSSATGGMKSAMGSFKQMGAGIGPALGVAAGVGLVRGAIAEAREAQKVGATTTQIIKATGQAAGITAGQVGTLATALSNKTGVDDEAIQTGANLILTFKNVRNEAGAGANIFDRATASAVDLSAAGFGSIDSASKALGKALNDPLKGITALSRAGVTFTQGQKDQIAAMVAAGDTLGAQKIILAEVESQVGGVAAASSTAGEKATVAWNNVKEALGAKLLPVFDQVLAKATPLLVKMSESKPILIGVGVVVGGLLVAAFLALAVAIFSALAPFLLVGIAIAALVALFVMAYQRSETFRAIVQAVLTAVQGYMAMMWTIAKAVFKGIVAAIGWVIDKAKALWNGIVAAKNGIVAAWNAIKAKVAEVVAAVVGKIADFIAKVAGIKDKVTGALKGAGTWLLDAGKKIIDGLLDGITGGFKKIKDKLGELTAMLPDWKGPARVDRMILFGSGQMVITGFVRGLESSYGDVQGSLGGLTSSLAVAPPAAGSLASGTSPLGGPLDLTDRTIARLADEMERRARASSVETVGAVQRHAGATRTTPGVTR